MRSPILLLAALALGALAAEPVPEDLDWLREHCGDGALAYSTDGQLRLTELSTGRTEVVGHGTSVEFSPDSSKLAWIEGTAAVGRLRKGDGTVHRIAEGLATGKGGMTFGVHWLSDTEVACALRRGDTEAWYRVALTGEVTPLPELTALWTKERETDVKRGRDGVWSLVAGRRWRRSDGTSGALDGGCSCSLSPDGLSTTALQGGHAACKLQPLRKGAAQGTLKWRYDGSFDNHRWSSNDPRFVVCVEEDSGFMVVMRIGETRCTRMGTRGGTRSETYGDFTVGAGRGAPWPVRRSSQGIDPRAPLGVPEPAGATLPEDLGGDTAPGPAPVLVYQWETQGAANEVRDPGRLAPRACGGECGGLARFGCYGQLLLDGGVFVADGADEPMLEACRQRHALTLEAVVTTRRMEQEGPARIITFSSGRSACNFVLGQQGRDLVLRLRTSTSGGNASKSQIPFHRLEVGRPTHVLVTYRPGDLRAYVDGKEVLRSDRLQGDFGNWEPQRLRFGDEQGGGRNWSGELEGVAIAAGYTEPEEARRRSALDAARRAGRRPPPRWRVEARMTARSKVPSVAEIAPYTRCLAEAVYEVERTVEGTPLAGRIVVAYWVILGGSVLPDERAVGQRALLTLEPAEAYPFLERERIVADSEDFEAPRFLDVAPPVAPPKR